MINDLIKINEKLLNKYKNNEKLYKKYTIIKKILSKKDCFLNIDIEYAYSILRDLMLPEEDIKDVYLKLINSK